MNESMLRYNTNSRQLVIVHVLCTILYSIDALYTISASILLQDFVITSTKKNFNLILKLIAFHFFPLKNLSILFCNAIKKDLCYDILTFNTLFNTLTL